MKKVSAGVVITNGRVVLGVKSYKWDLPKGEIEKGEKPIEAAVRETKEETGLKLNPKDLTELGFFDYTKNKDLWLYLYVPKELPDTSKMKCTTFFEDDEGNKTLEVEGYRYINFRHIERFYYRSICKVLRKVEQLPAFSNYFNKEVS